MCDYSGTRKSCWLRGSVSTGPIAHRIKKIWQHHIIKASCLVWLLLCTNVTDKRIIPFSTVFIIIVEGCFFFASGKKIRTPPAGRTEWDVFRLDCVELSYSVFSTFTGGLPTAFPNLYSKECLLWSRRTRCIIRACLSR